MAKARKAARAAGADDSPTYKKIEIVGTSRTSFSDAVERAIEKASESLHGLRWFEVVEERGKIEGGKVSQYQVTILVGFHLD